MPSKGLEPPHPCGYMDLNHARLPIPPRWQKVMRLHGDLCGSPSGENHKRYSTGAWLAVKHRNACEDSAATLNYPSSLAVMVILAFSTFDTGQPLFAFSAAFWKAAWSAFGTRPTTSR